MAPPALRPASSARRSRARESDFEAGPLPDPGSRAAPSSWSPPTATEVVPPPPWATAEAASAVAQGGGGTPPGAVGVRHEDGAAREPGAGSGPASKSDSLALLRRADEAGRAAGGAISQVQAGYGGSKRQVLIANSEGLLARDEQVRTRFSVSCVAEGDTGLQTGFESAARTVGSVSYTHLRAHETGRNLVCRLLLEK